MGCCFCEEYARPFDNPYYNEVGRHLGVAPRILRESEHWYAVPTLGCLTPGYVLLVTKEHCLSVANLDRARFEELLELKKEVEQVIERRLGLPCVAFEHGAAVPSCGGANSVDHVHLHILPFPRPVWAELTETGGLEGFVPAAGWEGLFQSWQEAPPRAYLLFQDTDGSIYYRADAAGAPSQLFRRRLAPYFGVERWNWREEPGRENLVKTVELFR